MLRVMLGLSWELTVLTCIEMPLLAMLQNKYIKLSKVGLCHISQIHFNSFWGFLSEGFLLATLQTLDVFALHPGEG